VHARRIALWRANREEWGTRSYPESGKTFFQTIAKFLEQQQTNNGKIIFFCIY